MKKPPPNRDLPADLCVLVDHYRENKIARIDGVLRALGAEDEFAWDGLASSDLPLRYALAHHVFEGVSRAAARSAGDAVNAVMNLRNGQESLSPLRTVAGPVLVARPHWEAFTEDIALGEDAARSAAPVAIVSPELCATATTANRELLAGALDIAAEAGFGATVSRNTRVVVLIAERRPTDAKIRSWTTSSLPATAHLDYFAEHRYLSRELVHEAAHSELNDLFAALDERFPEDADFYAPWLETERPAFGFLHGTWAFSHVALYCRWLADADVAPEVADLTGAMYAKYARHMHASQADFARAIRLVRTPELAELITRYRDEVLSGVSSAVTA